MATKRRTSTKANPFRKGKGRPYTGKKRSGTVFKVKGRYRIVVKTAKGRISRPWKKSSKKKG